MVKGPAALLAAILATTIVVLPTAAPAQAVITPPPVVEPTATVHGVVKDTTGAPIPGACVDVIGALSIYHLATTCVGSDGAYSLRVPAAYPYLHLSARAPGLNPVWWPDKTDHATSATSFALNENHTADFVLGGAVGTVSGSVTRQDGKADRYTWINLYPVGSDKPTALIIGKADGAFTRADIPVGQYQVKFTIFGHAEQWYPAKNSQAEAATITIGEGQTTSLTEQAIAMPTPPIMQPVTNAGGVVKLGGLPIADVEVTALNIRDGSITKVKSDATGKYRFDGLAARCDYSISATSSGRTVWAFNNVAPRLPACPDAAIDLSLPAQAGAIKATLRSYDGGALPNSTYATLLAKGLTVGRVAVRLDGTYEFANVPPGTYTIRYNTPKYVLNHVGTVSVVDGLTTEVTSTSLAPTYLEVTVKGKGAGNPVGGACISSDYASGCANAEGIALIGPMWNSHGQNYLRVKGGVDYFGKDFAITMKVGQVNPITVELEPAATVSFPVVRANGDKYNDQICVYALQPRFLTQNEPAGCSQPNADGIVRVGPFQPGTARLLIVPGTSNDGAQWLGPNGGTGQMEKATPIDLRTTQTASAPKATIDPGKDFTARLKGAPNNAFGCVSTAAGHLRRCANNEVNLASLGGLGPYTWPLSYSDFQGLGRTTVLARAGEFDVTLRPQGKLTVRGSFYPSNAGMPTAIAFDAYTGEVVSYASTLGPAGATFDRLGDGQVVIQFRADVNGSPMSCWLKVDPKPFRFGLPYFSTAADKDVVRSGVTCTQQEPLSLKVVEPGRGGLPVSPARTSTTAKGKLRGHSA